jgi:hypothetical protein
VISLHLKENIYRKFYLVIVDYLVVLMQIPAAAPALSAPNQAASITGWENVP